MNITLRLPDTWSLEMVDHLLDFANQLNNAILDQYGDALYEYWHKQNAADEMSSDDNDSGEVHQD